MGLWEFENKLQLKSQNLQMFKQSELAMVVWAWLKHSRHYLSPAKLTPITTILMTEHELLQEAPRWFGWWTMVMLKDDFQAKVDYHGHLWLTLHL